MHLLNFAKRTKLIISKEEMDDIMKIIKFLEERGLLVKGVSKTIKNEAKERKVGPFSMLLETLGASFIRKCINS